MYRTRLSCLLRFFITFITSITWMHLHASNRNNVSIGDLYDSDIPVVVINTVNNEIPTFDEIACPSGCWGVGITNVTKVPGRMTIILRNDTIYDSGDYKDNESGMTIKVRGNTSAFKDEIRKPYKIKLQKKADLLCRGDNKYKDKNWALLKKREVVVGCGFGG